MTAGRQRISVHKSQRYMFSSWGNRWPGRPARLEIRASPVVYGDETGKTISVQHLLSLPHSRGRTVVEEVLGDEFEGVLVSDFYGAYNVYQGPPRGVGPRDSTN